MSYISKVKRVIRQFKEKPPLEKKIIAITFAMCLFVIFHYFSKYFVGVLAFVNAVLWVCIFLLIMSAASFAVLKTFFVVSAGISLLIFLAQSYCDCDTSLKTPAGNEALGNLLTFGFIYVVGVAANYLRELLKEIYKGIKKEKSSIIKKFAIGLFFIFLIWFIYIIYLVIKPIVLNLCL